MAVQTSCTAHNRNQQKDLVSVIKCKVDTNLHDGNRRTYHYLVNSKRYKSTVERAFIKKLKNLCEIL